LVFARTGNSAITCALLVAVAVAWLISRHIYKHSYSPWQLAPRGSDLLARRHPGLLRATRITAVLRRQVATVGLEADLEQLKALFLHRHLPIFVIDDDGKLHGSIEFDDLADAAFDPKQEQPPSARDLVHRTPVALVPEDDLETALRLCEMNDEEHMPVVDNAVDMRVIGEVRYQDLVLAYNRALLAARAEGGCTCFVSMAASAWTSNSIEPSSLPSSTYTKIGRGGCKTRAFRCSRSAWWPTVATWRRITSVMRVARSRPWSRRACRSMPRCASCQVKYECLKVCREITEATATATISAKVMP
jgi:CBS domain-containing protein